jgi:uncharacterized protein DUF6049
MSTRRAAGALLVIAFVLVTLVAPPHGAVRAHAQEAPEVVLRLDSQTPWNTIKDPILEVSVRAENVGQEPVGQLSLGVTIGAALRSRNLYETSLELGPGLPVYAATTLERGTLEPGESRSFTASVDLSTVGGVSSIDSLVYPMRVDLRSADVPVAVVDTPVIYLVRKPERPLLLTWTIELSSPAGLDPDGRLFDPSFEAAAGADGSLGAPVRALRIVAERGTQPPLNLVVQPSVLEQLARMADGYERVDGSRVAAGEGGAADADALLASLRAVIGSSQIQLSATPFAGPSIPALLASGLGHDLETQWAFGRATVEGLLEAEPSARVVSPPGDALDDEAVARLVADGVGVILGDAGMVERPVQPNQFAPPPTASLAAGDASVALVVPDPGTQALLADEALLADPVRAAQATLGELAVIWREAPVPAEARGVAIALPQDMPAGFWGPFVRRVADAPFLRPVPADKLVRQIPPPEESSALVSPSSGAFSSAYADAIKSERRDVTALRSMLVRATPLPDRLERNLLYAEAAEYVGGELAGLAWIDQVDRLTESTFARAVPDTSQVFTFTSRTGTIPLRMGDPGETPLRVVVQLRSARLRFPQGAERTVTLARPNQIVTFLVEATATGQSSIQVVVRAPSGRPIQLGTLVVRSTAVNRIALIVTLAAALALVALWSRRLFRRPTS